MSPEIVFGCISSVAGVPCLGARHIIKGYLHFFILVYMFYEMMHG